MIPLRDNVKSSRFPLMSVVIIGVNIVVFVFELALDQPSLYEFFMEYGVVPQKVTASLFMGGTALSLVTAMFIHGGWAHIIGNMLYLWVFGDNVEDALGRFGFLLFYIGTGFVGNMAHVLTNSQSTVPTVGASGAVAGVLGAYFLLYPRARVLTLVPLGIFLHLVELPAFFLLLLWFVLQLTYGILDLGVQVTQGVAWWAHVGGFASGILLIRVLPLRTRW
jgi:membrane associated rhomboid family serine protease